MYILYYLFSLLKLTEFIEIRRSKCMLDMNSFLINFRFLD